MKVIIDGIVFTEVDSCYLMVRVYDYSFATYCFFHVVVFK